MRFVETADALAESLRTARSEARSAFGSDELILEKAIARPRHVEIQIFADSHGTAIHLGERDCSVQRRHQKVIEEAPSPVMTADLRARMGAAAIEVARAISYCGAGTVEFLLAEDGAFYFLEMNTRLQVEHAVTELVTGLDLVALQLRVAQGAPLGLRQEDIALKGHAIEARLYAEDPVQDFMPSTGRIDLWLPPEGEGIRVDAGVATGLDVSPFYDPMIAKIMAHGPTREVARRRLIQALCRTGIFGPATNRDFLIEALGHDTFAEGAATTAFIGEAFGKIPARAPDDAVLAAAAVLLYTAARATAMASAVMIAPELLDWSSTGTLATTYRFARDGAAVDVTAIATGHDAWRVDVDGAALCVRLRTDDGGDGRAGVGIGRNSHDVIYAIPSHGTIHLSLGSLSWTLRDRFATPVRGEEAGSGGRVTAPMHGHILEVRVSPGMRVARGDRLAVLEAMKMQHPITADVDGEVTAIHCAAGRQVPAGELLIEIAADEAAEDS